MSDEEKKNTIGKLLAHDLKVVQPVRNVNSERLDRAKPTSIEGQIAFIKELVKNENEAKAFMKDPKKYSVEHGVLLSPEVVKAITNAILYDAALDDELIQKLGPHGLKDLIDMRQGRPTGVQANAAAVAAGAAVVMAVVAVATLVVTLVRTSHPADLVSLQGLGQQGIKLPGNKAFVARDQIKAVNVKGKGL